MAVGHRAAEPPGPTPTRPWPSRRRGAGHRRLDAARPRPTSRPRAVRPDPVGGGDGRRPRSAPRRSAARGGHPDGPAADGLDGRRPGRGRRGGSGRLPVPAPASGPVGSDDGMDLAGSMADRLASALSPGPTAGPGPGGQRRPGADGRPRAGHLDHGRADGRLHPGRCLRRRAGRARDHRRPAARGGQPAGLFPAGRRRARRRRAGARRHPPLAAASCPGSATRCTSTATPGSPCCSTCSSSWPTPTRSRWCIGSSSVAAAHAIPLPNVDLGMAAIAWSTGMAAGRRAGPCSPWPGWPDGWPTISRSWTSDRSGTGPGPSTPPRAAADESRPADAVRAGAGRRRSAASRDAAVGQDLRSGHGPSRPQPRPHLPGDRSLVRHRGRDRPPAGRPGDSGSPWWPAARTSCAPWPTSWPRGTVSGPRSSWPIWPTSRRGAGIAAELESRVAVGQRAGEQRRLLHHGPGPPFRSGRRGGPGPHRCRSGGPSVLPVPGRDGRAPEWRRPQRGVDRGLPAASRTGRLRGQQGLRALLQPRPPGRAAGQGRDGDRPVPGAGGDRFRRRRRHLRRGGGRRPCPR